MYEDSEDAMFVSYYGLEDNDAMKNTIIVTYFSLTTLTSVGFGDYAPLSNSERVIWSIVLLLGLSVWSLING